jgi:magnesium transporter
VTVRGLALGELGPGNALRTLRKELGIGLINGGLFLLGGAVMVAAWFRDPWLGLVFGLAMLANLAAAGLAGVTVPLTLNRLGFDPAVSSSVFVTTVTDCIGFAAFLGLATLLLL